LWQGYSSGKSYEPYTIQAVAWKGEQREENFGGFLVAINLGDANPFYCAR